MNFKRFFDDNISEEMPTNKVSPTAKSPAVGDYWKLLRQLRPANKSGTNDKFQKELEKNETELLSKVRLIAKELGVSYEIKVASGKTDAYTHVPEKISGQVQAEPIKSMSNSYERLNGTLGYL